MMYRWRYVLATLAALVLVVLLGWGCYAAVTWRDSATIIVEDRWWVSATMVQYDVVDVDVTTDEDGNISYSTSTSTYTRCKNELTGRELPVVYPPPACNPRWGDYIRNGQWFYIRYHVQESSEGATKGFIPNLWDRLEPGREARVSWGLLRTITEAADAKTR